MDELVFPFVETAAMQGESINFGLTKRELFATMAMQGMLSQSPEGGCDVWENHPGPLAGKAIQLADALLAALAQPKQGKEGGE